MNIKDNYYTGREVQRLLGITEPALRNLVNQKKIKKIIPPGRRYGVYLKSEINTFAEKWHAFLLAEEPPRLTFNIATMDDMPSEYNLAVRALGATMSIEQRQSWIRKNPLVDYVVKYGSGVVAYCTILPLKSETIMAFMNGEIRGWQVTDDNVEIFEPNKDTECIIMGTATDPDVDETTRKHYMLVLIRGLRDELKKLGQRGVKLTKIYATSETPTGISMALHLGMEEWKPRLGKRIRFVLDVEQSDNFLLESYKEGYKEWQLNKQRTKPEKTSILER